MDGNVRNPEMKRINTPELAQAFIDEQSKLLLMNKSLILERQLVIKKFF